MYRGGLAYMRHSISDTAEWGDYVAGPRIVTPEVKKAMKSLLNDIQDGSFAKKFIAENESGRKEFARIRKAESELQIEKVGAELRKSMPFLDPVVVVKDGAESSRRRKPEAAIRKIDTKFYKSKSKRRRLIRCRLFASISIALIGKTYSERLRSGTPVTMET